MPSTKFQGMLPSRGPARSARADAGEVARRSIRQQTPAPIRGPASCACGGTCPRCMANAGERSGAADRMHHEAVAAVATDQLAPSIPSVRPAPAMLQRELAIAAQITSPATDDDTDDAVSDDDAEALAGNAACPVTAVFSSNVAGSGKAGCQVPQGQSGAARLAQYVVHGVSPIPATGLSIGEKFTVVDDPYSIAGKLKAVTATTDSSGRFDDCYILASKDPLPTDFRLKVTQNHLYGGQAISKNVITYSFNGVDVRHCKRKPGSCDFSDVCRLG